MNYLIISNGVAGTEAAMAIRKLRPHDPITIIASSNNLFYARPRLLEYLAGKATHAKITTYSKDVYENKRIQLCLGERVTRIDPVGKSVSTASGKQIGYDKLLLACGARPFIPPLPGSDKLGVFSLRGLSDADSIRSYCAQGDRILVIGGGLLGLEIAHTLATLGCLVTVAEFADRLLPRQLDTEGAGILQAQLESSGISFLLGEAVSKLAGGDRVETAEFKSGLRLDVRAVIFSTGVRSRLELAHGAGVQTNLAIVVNDHMETSVKDIYAAGDAIEHRGRCYGLWLPAKQQGEIAGRNMAGEHAVYEGTPTETRLKVAGISLFSAGDVHGQDAQVLVSRTDTAYRKLVLKDGKVAGAIILGDNPLASEISKAFRTRTVLDPIPEVSPPFEPTCQTP